MNVVLHIPYTSRLQDYVAAVWEITGKQNSTEIILPQGITEIIFNFADQLDGTMAEGRKILQVPRCFIQGIHTHSIHADYMGPQHLIGIRLHPYRVRDFLGILPSELSNTIVDLTLIKPGFNRLWHQLAELNSFEAKVKLLENELPDLPGYFNDRSQMLSNLFHSDGAECFKTVDELAQQVCYSPRQLNRVVHNLFGLSAEELTMYKKFVESIKLIHPPDISLTEVAYNAGFYDQAHFCRVFKSFTGMTPNSYRKRKSQVPFHIVL